jgi:hypothetical protein
MDFLKFRVKVLEEFKDGNVLDGKLLKTNSILIVSEQEKAQIEQSGGVIEVLEEVIPNPRKASNAKSQD